MWLYVKLIGFLTALLLLNGCAQFSKGIETSPSQIPLRDLALIASVYPYGWKEEGVIRNTEYVGKDIEDIEVAFRYRNEETSVSIHTILRYKSKEDADNGFDAIMNHNKIL